MEKKETQLLDDLLKKEKKETKITRKEVEKWLDQKFREQEKKEEKK